MFIFHRRILSLPASTGSLSFQSLRKGTPTYFLFPHFLIIARRLTLPGLHLRRRKPTLVLDQAAQVFDLAGVAGVADSMMSSGATENLLNPR
jgi:hypothetical protein